MQRKVIIITSFIISLLFTSTAFLYSETALSARPVKHHHRLHVKKHHIKKVAAHTTKPAQLLVSKQATESNTKLNVNPKVWTLALKAYNNAFQKGYVKQKILTIIDYSLPSSAKRMWVVDVCKRKVLYNTLVTHGKHTGGLFAKYFSDKPGSLASSIGTFVTENTYFGSKGYSLRLRGLEPGFNDKAKSRAIVVHGAWYATLDYAKQHGRLGLSWGCPAVAPNLAKPIINQIKNGTLVFAYYPDSKWLSRSHLLAT